MKITEKQKEDLFLYNTDKFYSDITKIAHAYGPYYNKLFEPLENEKISLLEIGIYTGGSVKLFADYFKNGKIVGVDINNYFKYDKIKFENLFLHFFDAYNLNNINQLPIKKYDIIIDDGPHTIDSQIFFLSNFGKFLNDNGTLILEDVPYYNVKEIMSTITCDKSNIKIYDWHIESERFDDVIIEFKNKNK